MNDFDTHIASLSEVGARLELRDLPELLVEIPLGVRGHLGYNDLYDRVQIPGSSGGPRQTLTRES
jgi:hypothetical protein